MRDLYAAELFGDKESSNEAAWPSIKAWADRHIALPLPETTSRTSEGGTGTAEASVTEEEASDGQRSLVLVQQDEGDASLLWRSEVALGQPASTLHATIHARIGPVEGAELRPMDYDFGIPGTARTLLREFITYDGLNVLPNEE